MNLERFHHGCIVTQIDDDLVLMVVGGLGPNHYGDSVESLSLSGTFECTYTSVLILS